jgi:hypothetical protein
MFGGTYNLLNFDFFKIDIIVDFKPNTQIINCFLKFVIM